MEVAREAASLFWIAGPFEGLDQVRLADDRDDHRHAADGRRVSMVVSVVREASRLL